jgi:hypothetical protein
MSKIPKWEYFVLNINFEDNQESIKEKVQKASENLKGSLSKEFLEKEFPNEFKALKPGLHPSKQLQVILNKIGNEGWKLEITERIGNLLMFIFIKEKLEN